MKTAVVLFNLGGPSNLQSVKPYLYNLFSDPAILRVSNPWREILARGISCLRESKTQSIYQKLGGKSPLLEHSERQRQALEMKLGKNHRVFLAMRYWHPRTEEVVLNIKTYQPDQIILLPLYPQYSTATTRSSLMEFEKFRDKEIPCNIVECFPQQEGFVQAVADQIVQTVRSIKEPYRLLFTAHGLPLKFIQQGDPYQTQVESSVAKVMSVLNMTHADHKICYQSRVGVLPWLMPYTIDEIKKAGQQRKSIVMVPISFVCENSETLYELDIQYKELAAKLGIPGYYRVPTVSEHPSFIQGLADLVKHAI